MYVWQLSVQDDYSNIVCNHDSSSYNKGAAFWCPCVTFHYEVRGQGTCGLDLLAQY